MKIWSNKVKIQKINSTSENNSKQESEENFQEMFDILNKIQETRLL